MFKWTKLTELHSYSLTIAVNSGRGGEETVHSGAAGLFHYLTEREKVITPGLTDSAWSCGETAVRVTSKTESKQWCEHFKH